MHESYCFPITLINTSLSSTKLFSSLLAGARNTKLMTIKTANDKKRLLTSIGNMTENVIHNTRDKIVVVCKLNGTNIRGLGVGSIRSHDHL